MELIAFYSFAVIVTLSALFVIAARNPVHSVLWLILAFFTSSGLLVLIGAEFLAMLRVVVYVGAVAVLLLFVVMMLDVDFVELKQGFMSYLPFAALVGIAFIAEIALAGFAREAGGRAEFNPSPGAATNTEAIGEVMYTQYFLLFFVQVDRGFNKNFYIHVSAIIGANHMHTFAAQSELLAGLRSCWNLYAGTRAVDSGDFYFSA